MKSTLTTTIQTSLKSPFLAGLSAADLDCVLAAARPRQLLARSIVVNQGSPADYLFLLAKGRARFFFVTEDGRKLLLHWLVPGDIFGAMALLSQSSSYLVGTEMVRHGCVLAWDRYTIRDLAARCPGLWENAMSVAADYLSFYVSSHVVLTCNDAKQRLAHALITLGRGIGEKRPSGIALEATNEELASAANITPFTTSRFLSEWQRKGVVAKWRGKILLKRPERLLQTLS